MTARSSRRGPDCCVGYTDPALTARAFDAEGWYPTGDVGVLDEDGYLTITDRISDIIIRGGENVSAQEIEELMLGMETVMDVAVVSEPDARLGEHASAVLVVRPGHDGARPCRRCGNTSPPPDWLVRSGPRRCTRSRSFRAPPRARCRSSASGSS